MLGLLSILLLKAQTVSNYVKENVTISVFLERDAKEADIIQLQKSIDIKPWRKSTTYISKDDAAAIMKKDLGENFITTLGENPLQASIEINLKADYATPEKIAGIEQELRNDTRIKDVVYQKDLVGKVNNQMGSIGVIITLFSGALLFVAVGLIFNTIRLAIYGQRFLIRTMDLVGATQAFIRRPFVLKSIINGIIGALLAIIVTGALLLTADQNLRDLRLIQLGDAQTLFLLALLQIGLGILITWISTASAVRKFLRQSTDALYRN
jgi:cell division transport system permease protein